MQTLMTLFIILAAMDPVIAILTNSPDDIASNMKAWAAVIPSWLRWSGGIFSLVGAMFSIRKLIKKYSPQQYVPLSRAVQIIGESDCYDYNADITKMWGKLEVKREQYYENLLLEEIKKEHIFLYGCKKFSATEGLQKIDSNVLCDNKINDDSCSIVTRLDEIMYTNLSIKRKQLRTLIKRIKKDLKR